MPKRNELVPRCLTVAGEVRNLPSDKVLVVGVKQLPNGRGYEMFPVAANSDSERWTADIELTPTAVPTVPAARAYFHISGRDGQRARSLHRRIDVKRRRPLARRTMAVWRRPRSAPRSTAL
jgi:hypothetical protein